ncbi:hypothetical protein [Leifsonia aquatica]|uniref:hypothetical protein n=1 Tax=Leifsonia aquatica TaxID=144185 RepID=UPI0013B429E6|nr:hypothetical protein [Leifsonia aquatica]
MAKRADGISIVVSAAAMLAALAHWCVVADASWERAPGEDHPQTARLNKAAIERWQEIEHQNETKARR